MRTLDELLQQRTYLVADHVCLADIALALFMRQFAHVDRDWFGQAPYPHLQAWLQGILESTLFSAVMAKQPT